MRTYLLVAVGGMLGASARRGVGELIQHDPGTFPWATLLVNVTGCALIGIAARTMTRTEGRWFFGVTGLLGGLTTYSAFADETRELLERGRGGTALVYVAASIVAGLAATEIARGDWSRS